MNKLRTDERFNEIIIKEIPLKIAEAFLDLEKNVRVIKYETSKLSNVEVEVIKRKANQMKEEINTFIDSQINRITNGSISQVHNENREIG